MKKQLVKSDSQEHLEEKIHSKQKLGEVAFVYEKEVEKIHTIDFNYKLILRCSIRIDM
jgi:hypothetical protein